jgi:hypothetical protein
MWRCVDLMWTDVPPAPHPILQLYNSVHQTHLEANSLSASQEFPSCYGAQNIITVFIKARLLSLSVAKWTLTPYSFKSPFLGAFARIAESTC